MFFNFAPLKLTIRSAKSPETKQTNKKRPKNPSNSEVRKNLPKIPRGKVWKKKWPDLKVGKRAKKSDKPRTKKKVVAANCLTVVVTFEVSESHFCRINVWYIYPTFIHQNCPNVGKYTVYTIHIDPMGMRWLLMELL